MDSVDDSEKQKIEVLQTKVYAYQNDIDLCSDLNSEQYVILAELQTVYNILNKQTSPNIHSLYNNSCKGVIDAMEQISTVYSTMTEKELYLNYIEKYREAKTGQNKLDKLLDIN